MEGSVAGHKRCREEGEALPEAKRLHAADLIRNILNEVDSDAVECDLADVELATVIKSLEEEIAVSPATIPLEIDLVDMDFLQEASDDELGIPPPAEDSSAGDSGEIESVDGFGRIWGYEDDVLPPWYEGLPEFGFLTEWDSGAVIEDGASSVLFDGDEFDFIDLAWRPPSLSSL